MSLPVAGAGSLSNTTGSKITTSKTSAIAPIKRRLVCRRKLNSSSVVCFAIALYQEDQPPRKPRARITSATV